MKGFLVSFAFLFLLVGCTKDAQLKNLALRHVIVDFDNQLAKLPDQETAKKVKAQTKMDVVSLEKSSDTKATAVVKINTVSPENLSQSESRDVSVQMEKGEEWVVKTP